jgi:hypothetical protein
MLPLTLMVLGFLLTPWHKAVKAGAPLRRPWMRLSVTVAWYVGITCYATAAFYYIADGSVARGIIAFGVPLLISNSMGHVLGSWKAKEVA